MPASKQNACIFYNADGYDPAKGLNGRRMAGQSFLKGFFEHADVEEYIAVLSSPNGHNEFAELAQSHGVTKPARSILKDSAEELRRIGTTFIPTPNYDLQSWERLHFGMESYSLCGLTHTIASTAVMEGVHRLRASPQAEWDAIICTSRAVQASMEYLFESVDDFLIHRFGSVPPRPQLPVVPLGIYSRDFERKPHARRAFRKKMQWTDDDIVITTVSRLTPYAKFDPMPLFIALQQAQKVLGSKKRLHFIACGFYSEAHSQNVFEGGAAALMPDVSYHFLDGKQSENRDAAYSSADLFLFPIDNVQESFGLSPIEAMAAGLPVIASDWDGLRDTVSPDVGIRVPTESSANAHTNALAKLYQMSHINYAKYCSCLSAQTEINIPRLVDAIVGLASNDTLRKKLGENAIKRVKNTYDWSVVIPQMQDVWANLAEIRARSASPTPQVSAVHPTAPPPMAYLSKFPGQITSHDSLTCKAVNNNTLTVEEMYQLRRYKFAGHQYVGVKILSAVMDKIRTGGEDGLKIDTIATALNINRSSVENAYLWLLKYGFIARVNTTSDQATAIAAPPDPS